MQQLKIEVIAQVMAHRLWIGVSGSMPSKGKALSFMHNTCVGFGFGW